MKSVLIISFIFMFFYQDIFAQNTNYFPIAIGNEYQMYDGYGYQFGKIERDTVYANGKTYFHLPSPFTFQDCRVDSNGNVLSISRPFFSGGEPEEYLLFKADAQLNEVWPVAWNYNVVIDTGYAKCIYDDSGYVFGEMRRIKGVLIFDESYNYYSFWLAEGIGLVRDQYDDGTVSILNYAKINGIEYGTIVSVNEDMPASPIEFTVSQNYPNPFNPIANIKFRTSNFGFVSLKVYDVLGNEIRTLVNEEKPAGEYQVTFNGSNLASGVYVYRLKTNGKIVSKKMILLK
ncbi:MAG: T9SS type A sorting domain-containing protein [Bacteroidetes bacterium]|nr:T9SS type A sorting domain-containing protein [Bacteroidota bacterium]